MGVITYSCLELSGSWANLCCRNRPLKSVLYPNNAWFHLPITHISIDESFRNFVQQREVLTEETMMGKGFLRDMDSERIFHGFALLLCFPGYGAMIIHKSCTGFHTHEGVHSAINFCMLSSMVCKFLKIMIIILYNKNLLFSLKKAND